MIKCLPWPYQKKCWRCNEMKPGTEFNSDRNNPVDWKSRRCRECHQKIKGEGRRRRGIPRRLPNTRTPEEIRKYNTEKNARQRRDLRLQVIEAYGARCQCPGGCSEEYEEFLAIDHIDGAGAEHRREIGQKIYSWLKRNGWPKSNFRLLCHNCNSSMGLYGYCPHERQTRMDP